MIKDFELLAFNKQGFIPGPQESTVEFLERIAEMQSCRDSGETVPPSHLHWVRERVEGLYGFEPSSIAVTYSNHQLAPWQGAACWIDESGISRLQLREGFRKGRYLGLYGRDEVIAHEAIHAARAAFNEPRFEEVFAYSSSLKKWRSIVGPLLQRPFEAWVVIGCVLGSLAWEPLGAIAWILMGLGFMRLVRTRLCLRRAAKCLMQRLGDAKKVRSVLFRMTDAEIEKLSQGYEIEGDDTLRWRLLRLAYFGDRKWHRKL